MDKKYELKQKRFTLHMQVKGTKLSNLQDFYKINEIIEE
jgi:hypothetical protein